MLSVNSQVAVLRKRVSPHYLLSLLFKFILLANLSVANAADSVSEWPWVPQKDALPVKGGAAIQYLGTGGIIVEVNGDAILADPFFSNPTISDLVFLKGLQPKKKVIQKYLPDMTNVKGMLVGHGHYDHLMDVPVVAEMMPSTAKVYGSDTAVHQIASAVDASQLVALNSGLSTFDDTDDIRWIDVSQNVRVMPIESGHAPHVGGYLFAGGEVKAKRSDLPKDVLDWQCGKAIAYVIEWLGSDKVIFRALYISSAAGFPQGVPPKRYLKSLEQSNQKFDVAILGVANFRSVDNYPQGLLDWLKPKAVVMVHWERFWEPYVLGTELAKSDSEVDGFINVIEASVPAAKLFLPRRLDKIILPIEVNGE